MNKCSNCGKVFDDDLLEYLVYFPDSTIAKVCCTEICSKELVKKEENKLINKIDKLNSETKIYKTEFIDPNEEEKI